MLAPKPRYAPGMSTSPLSPEEISAAAQVHRELGPEYSDAVVESFFEKVDREISARIDARLANMPQARRREIDDVTLAKRRSLLTGVAIGAAVAGIPLSWFAVNMATDLSPGNYTVKLLIIWSVIAAVYIAGAIRLRRPPGNR
jgi:hypothetical protein